MCEKQKLLKRKVKIGYHVFFRLSNVSPSDSCVSLPLSLPQRFAHVPSMMIDRDGFTLYFQNQLIR